jgi:hypothetical protein
LEPHGIHGSDAPSDNEEALPVLVAADCEESEEIEEGLFQNWEM